MRPEVPDDEPYRPIRHPARTLGLWILWLVDVVVCFLVRGITAQCDSGGCDNHALSAYNTIAWAGAILGGVLVVAGYALSRRGETESARVALITALYCFTTSVALVV